jgi:hypothetical protein
VTSTGEVVPSVTTIISRFKDSGGLLWWANKEGRKGLTLEEARAPAATAGTMAHDLVEAHINGLPPPELVGDADVIGKARAAFETYKRWQDMTHITVRDTEVVLVSDIHKFGGRLDAIGVHNDELCLLDWKSSSSLWADYLYQVAAYKLLWEETHPEEPLKGGVHLCRFSKDHADFTHSHFLNVEEEAQTFLLMRQLYGRVKLTESRVK